MRHFLHCAVGLARVLEVCQRLAQPLASGGLFSRPFSLSLSSSFSPPPTPPFLHRLLNLTRRSTFSSRQGQLRVCCSFHRDRPPSSFLPHYAPLPPLPPITSAASSVSPLSSSHPHHLRPVPRKERVFFCSSNFPYRCPALRSSAPNVPTYLRRAASSLTKLTKPPPPPNSHSILAQL